MDRGGGGGGGEEEEGTAVVCVAGEAQQVVGIHRASGGVEDAIARCQVGVMIFFSQYMGPSLALWFCRIQRHFRLL